MAPYFRRVIITDKATQLNSIRDNIQRNQQYVQQQQRLEGSQSSAQVEAMVLDWTQPNDINVLVANVNNHVTSAGRGIDVILASDVLYDAALSVNFFEVIRTMSLLSKSHGDEHEHGETNRRTRTLTIISQKLREKVNITASSSPSTIINKECVARQDHAASHVDIEFDMTVDTSAVDDKSRSDDTAPSSTYENPAVTSVQCHDSTDSRVARVDVVELSRQHGFTVRQLFRNTDTVIWGLMLLTD